MKRVLLILLVLICMTGCSKAPVSDNGDKNTVTNNSSLFDEEKESKSDEAKNPATGENDTGNATDSASVDASQTDKSNRLQITSEELAIQMANGDFEDTYKKLDPAIAKDFTMKALQQAWDDTVVTLGKYVDLDSSTYKEIDGYQVIDVVLIYEYNGFKARFTYNANEQLAGIHFTPAPIEEAAAVTELYEEIKINIDKGKYPLSGILTLPKNISKPPVAILVPGSGNNDANETVGANKFFRDLARSLAEKGISSIRYNERILMYPEIITEEGYTIQTDCLNDAADAIDYAFNSELVDNSEICVIGHSLGGMMAAKIATDNPQVTSVVILAGSPRKLEDIWYDQMVAELESTDGITSEQLKLNMSAIDDAVKQVKELDKDGPEMLLIGPASYWYSLNQIDIGQLATELSIPIFIAQGSEDYQVYADKDYPAWQKLLENKQNVSFKLYDNLNHIFMKSNGKRI